MLFRLLQGVFGAALVPLSQATMLDIYPVEQRGPAMAMWTMGVVVGPIIGPTLGGYLTDAYNWRWVFYINLPLGILATLGLWLFLKDTPRHTALGFDFVGFGVLSLGLGALQLMLDRGEQQDWLGSTEIIVYAVLCGLGFYLFVVHTLTGDKPMIPRRIFRDANFRLRPADDLLRRHSAAGDRRAAAAVAANAWRIFGGRSRPADCAARRRHHDRRDARGPPLEPRRSAILDVPRHSPGRRSRCGR